MLLPTQAALQLTGKVSQHTVAGVQERTVASETLRRKQEECAMRR